MDFSMIYPEPYSYQTLNPKTMTASLGKVQDRDPRNGGRARSTLSGPTCPLAVKVFGFRVGLSKVFRA